jgi:hypothetical protein
MKTTRLLPALAMALAMVPSAVAVERDFKALTGAIESHFNVKREEIPMMGLVKFIAHTASAGNLNGLELANFEGLEYSENNARDFSNIVSRILDDNWRPMIRVQSRRSGEFTSIWVRAEKGQWRMMIANLERDEANVIELKVNADELLKWVHDPEHAGEHASRIAESQDRNSDDDR